ncbi:MAG TPA: DMT family transporter [Ktedonobacteraceae bacterium]|nr:DMT family transporter [Ktedonobacteraceae bacterium]
MNHIVATLIFGLAASIFWGSGDFSGGLASRHVNASSVVTGAYAFGFCFLVILALIWREPFPVPLDLLWGGLAGIVGGLGLLSFYSALSTGKMGIIAPVSAVLTAAIPVLFSIFTAGLPTLLQLGGFVVALLAITFISRPERTSGRPKGLGLALLAGACFGSFFIIISRVHPGATFWPLSMARFISVLMLLILMRFRNLPVLPGKKILPLVALAGILDAAGNVFFVLAAHSGRLDVASILSSLYPAATVLLAAFILRERVTRIQGVGVFLVLLAIPMISA